MYPVSPQREYAALALGMMVVGEVELGQEYGLRYSDSNLSLRDKILSPSWSPESVALASRFSGRFRAPSLFGVGESAERQLHYACVCRPQLSTQLARQSESVWDRFRLKGHR